MSNIYSLRFALPAVSFIRQLKLYDSDKKKKEGNLGVLANIYMNRK
mgnify:CR=1 FL=1